MPQFAPEGIGSGHPANEIADFPRHRWPTTLGSAFPRPVVLETLPVPANHGLGLDDDQAVPPFAPGSSEPEPEDAVLGSQARAFGLSVKDDELLAQG